MLPQSHKLRNELNDEVHARPSDSLHAPLRISYVALLAPASAREDEWQHLAALVSRYGRSMPARAASHFSMDLGSFSLRFERHTEFTRYTITVSGSFDDPFAVTALSIVPADWVSALKGEVMVASHGAILPATAPILTPDELAAQFFDGNVLVGSHVGDDAATALTDFRMRSDGFSRFLILDRQLKPRQAGRLVQRLVEIDTYRMMALLTLPVARGLTPSSRAMNRNCRK